MKPVGVQFQPALGPKVRLGGYVSQYSIVDCSGFPHKVRKYFSVQQAFAKGYFGESHWAKHGREVTEADKPALAVAKAWISRRPREDGYSPDIILAYGEFQYLVTNEKYDADLGKKCCWPVYSKEQTRLQIKKKRSPKAKSKSPRAASSPAELGGCATQLALEEEGFVILDQKSSAKNHAEIKKRQINTNSSSITLPPYDGETIVEKAPNPRHTRELAAVINCARQNRQCRKVNNGRNGQIECRKLYFPEAFPWDDYPELDRYRSAVMYVFHLLHVRRFTNNDDRVYSKADYIPLKAEYLRRVIPEWRDLKPLLIGLGILDCDNHYEQCSKSYGYRLIPAHLRDTKRSLVPLDDPRLSKRLAAHRDKQLSQPVHKWLRDRLYELALTEIDEAFLKTVAALSVKENGGTMTDKLDAYHYSLEMIEDGYYHGSVDAQGRFHTNITNLKRELRSLLRISGQPLHEIDIRNSQLTFLALEMRRAGADCPRFFDLCEQGRLYEEVAEESKTDRPKVKKAITQQALFSPNDAPCQQRKIKRTFDRLFPEAAKFIFESKDRKNGHKLFARRLQRVESDFVVESVCSRLRREKNIGFVTPIHDSLLFLPNDGEYIMGVMLDEFGKLGLKPRLEIVPVEATLG